LFGLSITLVSPRTRTVQKWSSTTD
jgi:hypothetical protein